VTKLSKAKKTSIAMEVLQQMTSNHESHVIKQVEQMDEILCRKDEKIMIQKEMLET
jgi:predicted Zn-ribbon and HTH transcriptional regulator